MSDEFQRAFRRGERAALAEIYRQHVDAVERVLRRNLLRLQRFSQANLADLVQEVFLKAFSDTARVSYDPRRPYTPFLLTIARNVLLDWARRTGRELQGSTDFELSIDNAAEEEHGPFESHVLAVAQRYVSTLPAELAAVHRERFVLERPQRDAAQSLGVSRQTLRTLERKLLEGLKLELRRYQALMPRDGRAASLSNASEEGDLALASRR